MVRNMSHNVPTPNSDAIDIKSKPPPFFFIDQTTPGSVKNLNPFLTASYIDLQDETPIISRPGTISPLQRHRDLRDSGSDRTSGFTRSPSIGSVSRHQSQIISDNVEEGSKGGPPKSTPDSGFLDGTEFNLSSLNLVPQDVATQAASSASSSIQGTYYHKETSLSFHDNDDLNEISYNEQYRQLHELFGDKVDSDLHTSKKSFTSCVHDHIKGLNKLNGSERKSISSSSLNLPGFTKRNADLVGFTPDSSLNDHDVDWKDYLATFEIASNISSMSESGSEMTSLYTSFMEPTTNVKDQIIGPTNNVKVITSFAQLARQQSGNSSPESTNSDVKELDTSPLQSQNKLINYNSIIYSNNLKSDESAGGISLEVPQHSVFELKAIRKKKQLMKLQIPTHALIRSRIQLPDHLKKPPKRDRGTSGNVNYRPTRKSIDYYAPPQHSFDTATSTPDLRQRMLRIGQVLHSLNNDSDPEVDPISGSDDSQDETQGVLYTHSTYLRNKDPTGIFCSENIVDRDCDVNQNISLLNSTLSIQDITITEEGKSGNCGKHVLGMSMNGYKLDSKIAQEFSDAREVVLRKGRLNHDYESVQMRYVKSMSFPPSSRDTRVSEVLEHSESDGVLRCGADGTRSSSLRRSTAFSNLASASSEFSRQIDSLKKQVNETDTWASRASRSRSSPKFRYSYTAERSDTENMSDSDMPRSVERKRKISCSSTQDSKHNTMTSFKCSNGNLLSSSINNYKGYNFLDNSVDNSNLNEMATCNIYENPFSNSLSSLYSFTGKLTPDNKTGDINIPRSLLSKRTEELTQLLRESEGSVPNYCNEGSDVSSTDLIGDSHRSTDLIGDSHRSTDLIGDSHLHSSTDLIGDSHLHIVSSTDLIGDSHLHNYEDEGISDCLHKLKATKKSVGILVKQPPKVSPLRDEIVNSLAVIWKPNSVINKCSIGEKRILPDMYDVDISQKKTLILGVSRAVELVIEFFSKSSSSVERSKLGDTGRCRDIAHLLLANLCPALETIVHDGMVKTLKDPVIGSYRNSVWSVVEQSVKSSTEFPYIEEVVNRVKALTKGCDKVQKFNSFIFGLLNAKCLEQWLLLLSSDSRYLSKNYQSTAFMRLASSAGGYLFSQLVVAVQPLSMLPFRIELDIEKRIKQSQADKAVQLRSLEDLRNIKASNNKFNFRGSPELPKTAPLPALKSETYASLGLNKKSLRTQRMGKLSFLYSKNRIVTLRSCNKDIDVDSGECVAPSNDELSPVSRHNSFGQLSTDINLHSSSSELSQLLLRDDGCEKSSTCAGDTGRLVQRRDSRSWLSQLLHRMHGYTEVPSKQTYI